MSSEWRRYERLLKIIERIQKENQMGVTVIVEGRKDLYALKCIGLSGKIVPFKSSGRSLNDFVNTIHAQRVILLTDFDSEGRELAMRIGEELRHRRIHVNDVVRKQLAAIVKPEATKIEEIPMLIARMQSKLA